MSRPATRSWIASIGSLHTVPPAWGPPVRRTLTSGLPGRCRPLAPVGVLRGPRVQLATGLSHTKEKPTSLPAGAPYCPNAAVPPVSYRAGRPPPSGSHLAMTAAALRHRRTIVTNYRRHHRRWRVDLTMCPRDGHVG